MGGTIRGFILPAHVYDDSVQVTKATEIRVGISVLSTPLRYLKAVRKRDVNWACLANSDVRRIEPHEYSSENQP
jgi:hypothetical protein